MKKSINWSAVVLSCGLALSQSVYSDEGLFGYVKGAEPLPKGALDFEQWFTWRGGKEEGSYNALDTKTEIEYGVTDRFATSVAFFGLGINSSGLMIDAYIPGDKKYPWRPAGVEAAAKYNYLTPALDDFGLAQYTSLSYFWYDVNSGFRKNVYAFETFLLAQKYFLDGQLVWAGNIGIEADSATRQPIAGLPEDFEWPTTPEMEIAITISTGLTYRIFSNWFVGAEIFYQTEHETVGRAGALVAASGPDYPLRCQGLVGDVDVDAAIGRRRHPLPGANLQSAIDREDVAGNPIQDWHQFLRETMRAIPALIIVPAALVAPAVGYATEYLTVPQAQQIIFPDADRFVDASVELSDDQRNAIEKRSGVRQRWKKQQVWRAEKAGEFIGWLIIDQVLGKHEFITYAGRAYAGRQGQRHRNSDLPRDLWLSGTQR